MDDQQLLRYSRQILLPEIGAEGQSKLIASHVLIIGLGGLGSPAAMYLAAAGVGRLTLVDHDTVELSNLQRQIAHDSLKINQLKVDSAARTLEALNPLCQLISIPRKLDKESLERQASLADLVLDCTDNFTIRFAINAACVKTATPLISGAAIRWEGQITAFKNQGSGPCYQCLYPDTGELDENCTTNGVIAPLVGIIGSMQAIEAIKLLTGIGNDLEGRLLILDAKQMQWRHLEYRADPECPICGGQSS